MVRLPPIVPSWEEEGFLLGGGEEMGVKLLLLLLGLEWGGFVDTGTESRSSESESVADASSGVGVSLETDLMGEGDPLVLGPPMMPSLETFGFGDEVGCASCVAFLTFGGGLKSSESCVESSSRIDGF